MRTFHEDRTKSKGQILLVVILTVVIALTIGLSVASRSIVNVRLSKQNEESQRAFQAAEAGISQALKQIESKSSLTEIQKNLENSASFSTDITTVEGSNFLLNGGQELAQDIGIDVWLSDYPDYANIVASRTVTVYWGENGKTDCSPTATGDAVLPTLQLFVISSDNAASVSNPTVQKYLIDPCGATRTSGSEVGSTGGSVAGVSFAHAKQITVTNGVIMKVIPIYNSGKVGITADPGLPEQGAIIESVGTSGNSERKLMYYQSYPQIPNELFPYSIISQ